MTFTAEQLEQAFARIRPNDFGLTLAQAMAHPLYAPIVRAAAAQTANLQHRAAVRAQYARRACLDREPDLLSGL